MKKSYFFCIVVLITMLISGVESNTQTISREDIYGGYEYWFGIPFFGREQNEAIRGDYPLAIWISSKVDTRATVEDEETGSKTNVVIRKNQITQVPYGDHVMMKESEVVKNYGIRVTAEDPITVSVYVSYKWSGEAYRILPVSALGRSYVTMNMYQDQIRQTSDYRPPQILIIATEDNTKVTYRPTTQTAKGIKPGEVGTANLQRGQTFLIFGSIKEYMSQVPSTDLTGTYIQANKPIMVISGHTKVAIPHFQYTFLGRNGGFMRNTLIDIALPVELLGTEYVSAPLVYQDRPRGKLENDRGDLIRFVATEDGTTISIKDKSGNFQPISPVLNRGNYYDIMNQEEPAHYSANNKVLVAQYGKTWWAGAVTPQAKPGDDDIQNPSRNGQGCLFSLIPNNRFSSYSTWKSPEQIDNFLYVVFDADHLNHIYVDGVKLSIKYGNAIKYIDGTNFAYITESISAGDHYMYGDTIPGTEGKVKATFSAYYYGNWDRSKDGFAYGYSMMPRITEDCDETITVNDSINCGTYYITAEINSNDTNCGAFYRVVPVTSSNFNIDYDYKFVPGYGKEVNLELNVRDLSKDAWANVSFIGMSGLTWTKQYKYIANKLAVDTNLINFGKLEPLDTICNMTVDLVNKDTSSALVINRLFVSPGSLRFGVKFDSQEYPVSYPIVIPPSGTKTIELCAYAPNYYITTLSGNLIADMECSGEKEVMDLKFIMGDPIMEVDDLIMTDVHVGDTSKQEVIIKNIGTGVLTVNSLNWPDSSKYVFPMIEGLPCGPQGGDFDTPLNLELDEKKAFKVYFTPDNPGTFSTTAIFNANTNDGKLYSTWTGTSYTDIDEFDSELPVISFPNPASDYIEINIPPLERGPGAVSVFDVMGVEVLSTSTSFLRKQESHGSFDEIPNQVGNDSKVIRIDISPLSPGVYFVSVGGKMYKFVKM